MGAKQYGTNTTLHRHRYSLRLILTIFVSLKAINVNKELNCIEERRKHVSAESVEQLISKFKTQDEFKWLMNNSSKRK